MEQKKERREKTKTKTNEKNKITSQLKKGTKHIPMKGMRQRRGKQVRM